jgi:hypothetical protein
MSASKQQHQLMLWRRDRVIELMSKGHNQTEISEILKVNRSVISRDIGSINQQAKQNLHKFIDQKLPGEYQKCLVGINEVLKIAWNTTNERDIDRREKIQALSLVKECIVTKLELLTNASILDDAMKFVAKHQHQQQQHQQQQQKDQNNNKKMISTKEDKESDSNDDDNDNRQDETIEIDKPEDREIF